jgi:hypothetical protein
LSSDVWITNAYVLPTYALQYLDSYISIPDTLNPKP